MFVCVRDGENKVVIKNKWSNEGKGVKSPSSIHQCIRY